MTTTLPINEVLPEIRRTLLDGNNAVLIAPPGAGKTTGVPLALLNEPWLENRKIIMLEPRRLAARNAATWMARQLGESVGSTVGYRMRLDTRVSQKTKIEVVTEGILTRIIQNDISLDDYGLVIFDEFHERSLNADLGLALTLDIQLQLRETLRILVMSATLEGEVVSNILGNAPVITSVGRSFPVEIRYSDDAGFKKIEDKVVRSVVNAVSNDRGSILVFLPGVGEIERVYDSLQAKLSKTEIIVYPLYSNLPQSDQDKAIAQCITGERKIVLATSIAETSLTIDGVCIVIDAGLVRQPNFDPRSGLSLLETVRVSKASADQRTGRAGRTEPGVCYRLWSSSEQTGLIKQNQVEIKQADLSAFTLELSQWGALQNGELKWIDTPPTAAINQSRILLKTLGAIDDQGCITQMGVDMSKVGLHPRLAHMILKARSFGFTGLACDIAAILNERDYFYFTRGESNSDLSLRIAYLRNNKSNKYPFDRVIKQRILKNANDLRKQFSASNETDNDMEHLGVVLGFAYPDRIAKHRKNGFGRYQLSNGIGAQLSSEDGLSSPDFIVIANLRQFKNSNQYNEARVFLAAEITETHIGKYLSDLIVDTDQIEWDKNSRAVMSQRVTYLGKLALKYQTLINPSVDEIKNALIVGIKQAGIQCLPWKKQDRLWQQRLLFLKHSRPDENWPDVCDTTLLNSLDNWLPPFLTGFSRLDHLQALNLTVILGSMLDWKKQKLMDLYAPLNFKVPSGSNISIDYQKFESPFLAVRIQELFGLKVTPAINEDRTKLVLHLLSPAKRPIQVTQDLVSFWERTYSEVKKDLKGRYPKHYWPDDPGSAIATKRVKKHM